MASQNTFEKHAEIMKDVKKRFQIKQSRYGDSWKIMDTHFIANRIMVKCERILQILTKGVQQVEDDISTELSDIINYALIALMQIKRGRQGTRDISSDEEVEALYDTCVQDTQKILQRKNHDYNDAWVKMHYTSLITQIKVKLARILHESIASIQEDPTSAIDQYEDIVNYAVFSILHPQAPHNT